MHILNLVHPMINWVWVQPGVNAHIRTYVHRGIAGIYRTCSGFFEVQKTSMKYNVTKSTETIEQRLL